MCEAACACRVPAPGAASTLLLGMPFFSALASHGRHGGAAAASPEHQPEARQRREVGTRVHLWGVADLWLQIYAYFWSALRSTSAIWRISSP